MDSNVVLPALLFSKGHLTWLRHTWITRQITPPVNQQTIRELLRVLAYPKFQLTQTEIETVPGDFLPFTEVITQQNSQDELPLCHDNDDQKFLVLAANGYAEMLVTGDKALLELDGQTDFGIKTPAQLREILDAIE
ncbi:MAG: putative toxin-antitoxin system toxin component, PIN family [Gammaproteobacteria bacterium]